MPPPPQRTFEIICGMYLYQNWCFGTLYFYQLGKIPPPKSYHIWMCRASLSLRGFDRKGWQWQFYIFKEGLNIHRGEVHVSGVTSQKLDFTWNSKSFQEGIVKNLKSRFGFCFDWNSMYRVFQVHCQNVSQYYTSYINQFWIALYNFLRPILGHLMKCVQLDCLLLRVRYIIRTSFHHHYSSPRNKWSG